MNLRKVIGFVAATLCLGAPALAHHSQVMFDQTKMVTLSGVVTRFAWINPHVQIFFEVDNDGKKQIYQIEANSALTMGRAGWKRDQFKAGDKVTVSFHPNRDGRSMGYLRKIVGPDDKPLEMTEGPGDPAAKAVKRV